MNVYVCVCCVCMCVCVYVCNVVLHIRISHLWHVTLWVDQRVYYFKFNSKNINIKIALVTAFDILNAYGYSLIANNRQDMITEYIFLRKSNNSGTTIHTIHKCIHTYIHTYTHFICAYTGRWCRI